MTSEARKPHGIARVLLIDWLAAILWIMWGAMLCLTVIGIYPGYRSIRRGFRIIHQGNLDILSHGDKNRLARVTPVGRAFGYRNVDDQDDAPS